MDLKEYQFLNEFDIEAELLSLKPIAKGHIHKTYLGSWQGACGISKYIHQKINTQVFKDYVGVNRNISLVTEWLEKKIITLSPKEAFSIPKLCKTKKGSDFLDAKDKGIWRTLTFIEHEDNLDICPDSNHAFEAAKLLGKFQSLLADFPLRSLSPTLPDFDDAKRRLVELKEAVREDRFGRVQECRQEIQFVEENLSLASLIFVLKTHPDVPLRVAHHDTKFNNFLFDKKGHAIAIVDLDTCMPGCSLYDFGDLVRSSLLNVPEDFGDITAFHPPSEHIEACKQGYLQHADSFLSDYEKEKLLEAPAYNAFNLGLRFLVDYLKGDRYFKVLDREQNLRRARIEFALANSLKFVNQSFNSAR